MPKIKDESPELTASQREDYRWAKQLIGPDEQIRDFVLQKLISIHGSPQTQTLVTTLSTITLQNIAPPPPQLPDIAFGAKQWKECFGIDIGEEPPLPADIEKILSSSCPFFFRSYSRCAFPGNFEKFRDNLPHNKKHIQTSYIVVFYYGGKFSPKLSKFPREIHI